eukprot:5212810-Pleurochrysis_carterae.AAC.2
MTLEPHACGPRPAQHARSTRASVGIPQRCGSALSPPRTAVHDWPPRARAGLLNATETCLKIRPSTLRARGWPARGWPARAGARAVGCSAALASAAPRRASAPARRSPRSPSCRRRPRRRGRARARCASVRAPVAAAPSPRRRRARWTSKGRATAARLRPMAPCAPPRS